MARQVICQTGCEGHGHPWLLDEGQCGLTGERCSSQGEPPASERPALPVDKQGSLDAYYAPRA